MADNATMQLGLLNAPCQQAINNTNQKYSALLT